MTRLLISTILLFGFQSKASLPTIEICIVDMDILTRSRVACSKFAQSFNEEKKCKRLRVQNKIDRLLNELKNLKTIKDCDDIDTRAQILIKYEDHVDTICANR